MNGVSYEMPFFIELNTYNCRQQLLFLFRTYTGPKAGTFESPKSL